jgi:EAL domain-containing protein (putative c-di-GMP-specific phosphodiesterase class I)
MAAASDQRLLASTGQWLILEACTQLRAWDADTALGQTVSVSVNVSASQLADAAFVTGVEATLRSTGIAPTRLHLEIAESGAAADAKLTTTVLSNLKRVGVGIVLNDFGAGILSLSGLRQFPVEALKISSSLIGGMLLDLGILETVELVLLVAHRLKFKAIAEGIESAKQIDLLRQSGCELGQGHFFSQPVEAKAAEELLR